MSKPCVKAMDSFSTTSAKTPGFSDAYTHGLLKISQLTKVVRILSTRFTHFPKTSAQPYFAGFPNINGWFYTLSPAPISTKKENKGFII